MKRAFTLIELMLVISMITLMVSIVQPKMGDAKKYAKVANVQSNLWNTQIAIEMFRILEEYNPVFGKDLLENGSLSSDMTKYYTRSILLRTPNSPIAPSTTNIYTTRNNEGGWLYVESMGRLYANLENGNYTGDPYTEVWNGEFVIDDYDDGPEKALDLSLFATEPFPFGTYGGMKYNEATNTLDHYNISGMSAPHVTLKLNSENTELKVINKVIITADSKISETRQGVGVVWTLVEGANGLYTYEGVYENPLKVNSDEDYVLLFAFLEGSDKKPHSVYDISFEGST